MGAAPTKLQLHLLPGKPGKFHEGSRVAVWYMGREPGVKLTPDYAKITAVYSKSYDLIMEKNDDVQFKVPYYMVSYPNEERTWGAFYREGQRVLYKGKEPCTLINIDRMEDNDTFHLALRSLRTGKIYMHLTPLEVEWDYKFFS